MEYVRVCIIARLHLAVKNIESVYGEGNQETQRHEGSLNLIQLGYVSE